MDKFGVDEQADEQSLEKQAGQECPRCGRKVERHGKVLVCPNCGSEPFEHDQENK